MAPARLERGADGSLRVLEFALQGAMRVQGVAGHELMSASGPTRQTRSEYWKSSYGPQAVGGCRTEQRNSGLIYVGGGKSTVGFRSDLKR